jgi:hypothetical protein
MGAEDEVNVVKFELVATCSKGMETALASELAAEGAENIRWSLWISPPRPSMKFEL